MAEIPVNSLHAVSDDLPDGIPIKYRTQVLKVIQFEQSLRSMRQMDASLRKASALRDRLSKSLAGLRHRPCHTNVRSTTHRLGRTSKPLAVSERLTFARKSGCLLLSLGEDRSVITAIGEQFLQERIAPEQRLQDQHAAVAITDIGWMNQRAQQKPYRIDEDMAHLTMTCTRG